MNCLRRTACLIGLLAMCICDSCGSVSAGPASTRSAGVTGDAPLPTTPGDHKLRYRTVIDGKKVDLVYVLRLPKGYDQTTEARPVLVFTHGAGECGVDCAALYVHGPLAELDRPDNKTLSDSFPFILIAPQCPPRGERWDQAVMYKAVAKLTADLLPKLRADVDHVYLTGLSMGGKGTWLAGMAGAEIFSAIVPIASYGEYTAEQIAALKHTGVWMIAGTKDPYAVEMNNKMLGFLRKSAAFVRNTIVPEADHEVWGPFFSNAQFYETLLSLKRPTTAEQSQWDALPPYLIRPPTPMNPTFGHHSLTFPVMIKDQPASMLSSVFVPKSYQVAGTASPLIVYLHPYKVMGTRVGDLWLHGIDAALTGAGNEGLRDSFPAVVFSPQCPPGIARWDDASTQKAVLGAIEEVASSMNIDKARIYVVGENDGAVGALHLVNDAPERFAAVAAIHPEAAFTKPPGKPPAGVAVFPPSDPKTDAAAVYQDAAFYEWLFKQKK